MMRRLKGGAVDCTTLHSAAYHLSLSQSSLRRLTRKSENLIKIRIAMILHGLDLGKAIRRCQLTVYSPDDNEGKPVLLIANVFRTMRVVASQILIVCNDI